MKKPVIIQGALNSELDKLLKVFLVNKKEQVGTFDFYEY